jgi:hypothetical protein
MFFLKKEPKTGKIEIPNPPVLAKRSQRKGCASRQEALVAELRAKRRSLALFLILSPEDLIKTRRC